VRQEVVSKALAVEAPSLQRQLVDQAHVPRGVAHWGWRQVEEREGQPEEPADLQAGAEPRGRSGRIGVFGCHRAVKTAAPRPAPRR